MYRFAVVTVYCNMFRNADLAHLVERHLAKVEVASSSLVIRSIALYYLFHCKAYKVRACTLYFF